MIHLPPGDGRRKTAVVVPCRSDYDVNLALSLPETLTCLADGREFDVVSWEPAAAYGEPLRARVEVLVRVPNHE